jgi:hypothetical protein
MMLRLPLALFRLFLSANILLPTIDSAAQLREMAFEKRLTTMNNTKTLQGHH